MFIATFIRAAFVPLAIVFVVLWIKLRKERPLLMRIGSKEIPAREFTGIGATLFFLVGGLISLSLAANPGPETTIFSTMFDGLVGIESLLLSLACFFHLLFDRFGPRRSRRT